MAVNQDDVLKDLDESTLDDQEASADDEDQQKETEADVSKEDEKEKHEKAKEEKGDIPYAALKKEREKWQRRMEDMEEKLAKYDQLEQKLDQYYQANESQKNKNDVPDFEENPAENLRARQEQLEQNQHKLSENVVEQEKYQEQLKKEQELITAIHVDETRFLKEKPDYYKALNLVMEKEMDKYKLAGYDDVQAQKELQKFVAQIASQKIEQHESPAEYVYELAKFYGYKNEEVAKAEEKIDQLEEGMKTSKNLGSGNKPKLDELEKASMSEFDQAIKEMFG